MTNLSKLLIFIFCLVSFNTFAEEYRCERLFTDNGMTYDLDNYDWGKYKKELNDDGSFYSEGFVVNKGRKSVTPLLQGPEMDGKKLYKSKSENPIYYEDENSIIFIENYNIEIETHVLFKNEKFANGGLLYIQSTIDKEPGKLARQLKIPLRFFNPSFFECSRVDK